MQNAEFSPIHPPFEQGVKRFIFGEIAKPSSISFANVLTNTQHLAQLWFCSFYFKKNDPAHIPYLSNK